MTALAFFIGLGIGMVAGYFIGNRGTVDHQVDEVKPDFDLSSKVIDEINNDLLSEDGKYRFGEGDENMRYISFMDSLLMNLNSENNAILLSCPKNLDTAIKLLEDKQFNTTGKRFSAEQISEAKDQMRRGEPFPHEAFYKTCPPYDGEGRPPADWWSNVASKTVMNLCPSINVEVSLLDPNNEIIEVKPDKYVYDLATAMNKNKMKGSYTILYKITDLEKGKVSRFVHTYYGVPSPN